MKGASMRGKVGAKIRWSDPNPRLAAAEHPTLLDIVWAAGIFEGEGTVAMVYVPTVRRRIGRQILIVQKDPWILYKLQRLFGGYVGKQGKIKGWQLSGARARGFAMTIYKFLSPRRQAQVFTLFGKV